RHLAEISAGLPHTPLVVCQGRDALRREPSRRKEIPLLGARAMEKNYRWMWLRPLRKDKCAGQCYVAAGKLHCFFGRPVFLRGLRDQSTLSTVYRRNSNEKDQASEQSPGATRGTRTKVRSTS